jgi:DNA-binding NtrC family response regulator
VPRALIVDDDLDVLTSLRIFLEMNDFEVRQAASPTDAEQAVLFTEFDAALIDMNYARDTTSGEEGLDLVTRLLKIDSDLPIVVMTAWGSTRGAVQAVERGAKDYIEKPWDNDRLLASLRTQVNLRTALRNERLLWNEREREREKNLPQLIGDSKAMVPVKKLMQRVAESAASVLITGEHGTGKDVVARWIHAASSRANKPFIAVNAGALADGVFESELFGHVKGAFTDAKADRAGCFELAHGGTLFLDEIGTMPPAQQAKLLRVLQTGEFSPVGSSKTRHADVRVLAATNIAIADEVRRGQFREDLLYRLNTVEIDLPPLRDRGEDLAELAKHFLRTKAKRYGKDLDGFTGEALAALSMHPWPGNVRELEHVVERAVVLAEKDLIDVHDLALKRAAREDAAIERMTLADAEAYLIRKAMERAHGNVQKAAEALGLSRSAIYRRLQALGYRVHD